MSDAAWAVEYDSDIIDIDFGGEARWPWQIREGDRIVTELQDCSDEDAELIVNYYRTVRHG